MQPESNFVDVAGRRPHYLLWKGDGPPLLILHGNTHCGGLYAPLAERLASDFSVCALDLRGHGLSAPGDSYSWQSLRDDALGVIDALDLRDLVIVAHSRGGGVALLAAASRPERISRLIVYEPNVPRQYVGHAGESIAERSKRLAMQALKRRWQFGSRADMYRHYQGRGAFAGWRDEYLRAYVEHGAVDRPDGGVQLANPPAIEALMYEAMADLGAWTDLPASDVPVLALYGELSGRLGEGMDPVSVIRRTFRDVQVRILPGCTHSGPMERPDLFEQAIRDFTLSG